MMNGLDLFSGIGGISLAFKGYVNPVAYCEIDPYCQQVLLSRMHDGSISRAPIWDDIRTLKLDNWPIDIIYGGFPCQDISLCRTGKGLDGEQSGLFFEIIRLAKEIKPSFIFIENVPAITTRGGNTVVNEITSLGYDCRWCVVSAASIGAPHIRKRWFLLAHATSTRKQGRQGSIEPTAKRSRDYGSCILPNWSENEPVMAGMDDGILHRTHRTKSLGNAVVPRQARRAFELLSGLRIS